MMISSVDHGFLPAAEIQRGQRRKAFLEVGFGELASQVIDVSRAHRVGVKAYRPETATTSFRAPQLLWHPGEVAIPKIIDAQPVTDDPYRSLASDGLDSQPVERVAGRDPYRRLDPALRKRCPGAGD